MRTGVAKFVRSVDLRARPGQKQKEDGFEIHTGRYAHIDAVDPFTFFAPMPAPGSSITAEVSCDADDMAHMNGVSSLGPVERFAGRQP